MAIALALAGIAAAVLVAGCEMGDSGGGLDLTPSSVTLTPTSNTVWLTANVPPGSSLLPLTWTVADPTLGGIVQNGGTAVLYQASGALGVNVVIARATDGTAGAATVSQPAVSGGALTVTPSSPILGSSNLTVLLTASLGPGSASSMLPLKWEVRVPSLGSITRVSGLTAVYTRNAGAVGNNTVGVRAADGTGYSVLIRQQ
jgi:hypothetical protein